ncbi:hypothetical protein B0H16DRAFT_1458119 [Mycena metata]|uniref:Uncharacterized protein n=1 Tax=Mycena metata TaxID=1033252 RepID=A0AAD7J8C8_9AGAR|nr:hypothetical protein B0H16DRAFT_1458119 [Mycena metata]
MFSCQFTPRTNDDESCGCYLAEAVPTSFGAFSAVRLLVLLLVALISLAKGLVVGGDRLEGGSKPSNDARQEAEARWIVITLASLAEKLVAPDAGYTGAVKGGVVRELTCSSGPLEEAEEVERFGRGEIDVPNEIGLAARERYLQWLGFDGIKGLLRSLGISGGGMFDEEIASLFDGLELVLNKARHGLVCLWVGGGAEVLECHDVAREGDVVVEDGESNGGGGPPALLNELVQGVAIYAGDEEGADDDRWGVDKLWDDIRQLGHNVVSIGGIFGTVDPDEAFGTLRLCLVRTIVVGGVPQRRFDTLGTQEAIGGSGVLLAVRYLDNTGVASAADPEESAPGIFFLKVKAEMGLGGGVGSGGLSSRGLWVNGGQRALRQFRANTFAGVVVVRRLSGFALFIARVGLNFSARARGNSSTWRPFALSGFAQLCGSSELPLRGTEEEPRLTPSDGGCLRRWIGLRRSEAKISSSSTTSLSPTDQWHPTFVVVKVQEAPPPDMVQVVNIKPVMQLQHCEVFAPGGPNLGCNINPKPLDSHIMIHTLWMLLESCKQGFDRGTGKRQWYTKKKSPVEGVGGDIVLGTQGSFRHLSIFGRRVLKGCCLGLKKALSQKGRPNDTPRDIQQTPDTIGRAMLMCKLQEIEIDNDSGPTRPTSVYPLYDSGMAVV